MPKMIGFLHENHQGGLTMTLMNVLSVLGVLNVLMVLDMLNLLDMPKDESSACWASFIISK